MQEEFERILFHALDQNISDIHIILKHMCVIYFRTFGQLVKYTTIERDWGVKLMTYIRFLSKIDLNYQWKPQTGNYIWYENQHSYYLRISSLPSNKTDSIVIRILNNHAVLDIDTISYFSDTRKFLLDIANMRHGLFIVSGATGSGKSTTLYTLLDTINTISNRSIITLEDPVEVEKEYCLQIQINDGMGITYQDTLKQVLRHDPDVIMIGEIRDKSTAKLAINCALTGHLVLTTLHAGNCLTSIQRMLHLEISTLDLKEILVGILNQSIIFTAKDNKPIVLSEFMNGEQIQEYFDANITNYTTYSIHAKQLVEDNILTKDEVKGYI